VLRPFLAALIWAVMLAMLFRRMQVTLQGRLGPGRAALLTTTLVALLIVAPAVMLISTLAQEIPRVTDYVTDASRVAPEQILRLWTAITRISPIALPPDPNELLAEGTRRVLGFLAPRAGAFVADFFATIGSLVAMLFALFFMLRDGDAMSRTFRNGLPFPPEESDRLLRETHTLVVAGVGAGLIVAVAQGLIGGLAFWAVGISAPVFWGVVTGFLSVIPLVGAALVWVPAAIMLLLTGHVVSGIVLTVIGALGISMADNVLRPLLLSGRTSVNGLIIFFGLLGGAAAFGFVGLVIGPIVLVITGRLLTNLRHAATGDSAS
jgi:predicted PurR-regulated permease PerM